MFLVVAKERNSYFFLFNITQEALPHWSPTSIAAILSRFPPSPMLAVSNWPFCTLLGIYLIMAGRLLMVCRACQTLTRRADPEQLAELLAPRAVCSREHKAPKWGFICRRVLDTPSLSGPNIKPLFYAHPFFPFLLVLPPGTPIPPGSPSAEIISPNGL